MRRGGAFHPKKRMILMCDFDRLGFVRPVPLSATEPRPIRPCHMVIDVGHYESLTARIWAKCDMLTHVSLNRLDRVKLHGKTFTERLDHRDFHRILVCVAHATGTNLDKDTSPR